ncbi:MAG: hypothetical protein LBS62_10365 [Clostridiales bacterium]|jgi:flagellar operon protein|nr:hypothetical protein [Clostridiales bacterium]
MIQNNLYPLINPAQEEAVKTRGVTPSGFAAENGGAAGKADFQSILQSKIFDALDLTFSKHAILRLNARGISLTQDQLVRVEGGVRLARDKGVSDSLVLVDNIAFLVNIKNKTVITAMNSDIENVYTNIDGAVIV